MLRPANNRRRPRFVPSLGLGASTLESRELLSAMGGLAAAPIVHQPVSHPLPPNGAVGPIVADSATAPGHPLPPNGAVGPILA